MIIEGTIADFNGESAITVFFTKAHNTSPVVTVMPEGSTANVNLFITSVDKDKVVINSSEDFSGKVHIQAWSKEF